MNDDAALLRKFVVEASETAFTQLVRQRVDFVYAVALRQVAGDAHLAEEVAQNVFLVLARKAEAVARRDILVSWLYTTTRLAALQARRNQVRWHQRQWEAHQMQEMSSAEGQPDWPELRPVLDEAMHELGERDRAAILLRYFEGRPLAQVGQALGLGENSARMRVDRALEKLREGLGRRGITSTGAALATALASQPAVAAPQGLALAIAGTAVAGLSASGAAPAGVALFVFMIKSKAVAVVLVLLGVGMLGGLNMKMRRENDQAKAVVAEQAARLAELRAENRRLQALAVEPPSPTPIRPMETAGAASETSGINRPEITAPVSPRPPMTQAERQRMDVLDFSAPLFRRLGLTETQQNRYLDLRQEQNDERRRLVAEETTRRGEPPDAATLAALSQQSLATMWQKMDATFGAAVVEGVQRYEEAGPIRPLAQQLTTKLRGTGEALTVEQSDRLEDLVGHHSRGHSGKIEREAVNDTTLVPELRGILTAPQVEAFIPLLSDWTEKYRK
jgi:RNA polymerase sigma factor (sigma-70 family)